MKVFDFTYDSYQRLLEVIGRSFRIVTAEEVLGGVDGRWCLLRHDVDNGLELALKIARIEESLGIVTTYYLMCSSSIYNCFSPNSRRKVGALLEMGHRLGLHFCLKSHGKCSWESIIEQVLLEKGFLEKTFGVTVSTVSFHQPKQAISKLKGGDKFLNRSLKEYGLLNVYSVEDTYGALYLSDSLMDFKGTNPLSFFEDTEVEKVSLVIHPVWYDEETGDAESRWDRMILSRFNCMLKEKMENELSMNLPRKVSMERYET